MSAFIVLTGQVFSRLTVLDQAGWYTNPASGQRTATWHCQCECGNACVVLGSNLNRGATRSCGCLQQEKRTELNRAKAATLSGQVFGSLTVLAREGSNAQGKSVWQCRCACGNTTKVAGKDLVSGGTASCGCAHYGQNEKGVTARYRDYKKGAANRGYSFELTLDDFDYLTAQPCAYCHKEGKFGYAGIDRVDNDQGYVYENCVPCCRTCNVKKNDFPVAVFLERLAV